MELFEIAAALLSLAALFSFLNYHFFRLPTTIGLMIYSLLLSRGMIVAGEFNPPRMERVTAAVVKAHYHWT